jgi:hypothetical protein
LSQLKVNPDDEELEEDEVVAEKFWNLSKNHRSMRWMLQSKEKLA